MEKLIYLNNLFDLYGTLLTDKQQLYFNAIFKQLKIIEEKLCFFEEKLKLYNKKQKISDIIKLIDNKKVKDDLENLF